jgi:hypothetical protein
MCSFGTKGIGSTCPESSSRRPSSVASSVANRDVNVFVCRYVKYASGRIWLMKMGNSLGTAIADIVGCREPPSVVWPQGVAPPAGQSPAQDDRPEGSVPKRVANRVANRAYSPLTQRTRAHLRPPETLGSPGFVVTFNPKVVGSSPTGGT